MTDTDPNPITSVRHALLATLDTVEPLTTMSHDELVVIPLRAQPAGRTNGYVTLADEAPGAFEFSELDGGSVPTVQVKVGPKPLVVLAGETIVGGKQNRIINVSIWLAPLKVTPIPVSCLEHGRWNSGYRFGAGPTVDLDFRAKVSGMVNRQAVAGRRGFYSDQGAVWHEISEKERLHARRSATGALHDLYSTETTDLESIISVFQVPRAASGLAVGIGGKLVAIDLFDSPATLRRQWRRLITSAATALIDHRHRVAQGWLPEPKHRQPGKSAVRRMVERAQRATADALVNRSVGEGWDVRLQTRKLHGSALVHDGRVVHLALFRDEPPPPPAPPAPPRRENDLPTHRPTRPDLRTREGMEQLRRYLDAFDGPPDSALPNAPRDLPVEQPVAVPVRRRGRD